MKHLVGFLCEQLPFDSLSIADHFLLQIVKIHFQNCLTNLQLFEFPFYVMFTEFYKNSKVVSSDFSMMKNITAPPSPTSLIKLIC